MPFGWPVHELPWDFWRFTHEAFHILFPKAFGLEVEAIGYDHPLHMHMDDPPPGLERFHENQCYGFFGAKIRKVQEVELSSFCWPVSLEALVGETEYPRH